MAWNIFGKDTTPEQLPAELRAILAEMKRERVAFENLTNSARDSGQSLTQLMQPLTEAQKVVSELQARVKSLERLVPVLATLDEQTENVSKSQRRTETQLTQNSDNAKQLRGEIDELRGVLEQALALKNDVAGFLELGGGFKALRMDADTLSGAVRELSNGFDQVRARQEELRKSSESIAARFGAFEERQVSSQRSVSETESRAATVGQTLKELTQAAAEAAQTKRQLTTLKTLADGVTAKVAALEQQRDVVDRATAEVGKLHELMGEVDAKIRRHEASAKGLGELESKVGELRALHAEVLERSTEITANHDAVKQADDELRARLVALRDDVQRAVKRFELENQGLDAVGQRIVDLRGGLTAMEGRFKLLEESSRTITDVHSKADGLATQLEGIAENVALLGTQAERVRTMETSTGRLGNTVEEMTQRVAQLEKSHPGVQAALEDVAMLRGTHESVRGALEQVEGAADEMARVLEQQSRTAVAHGGCGRALWGACRPRRRSGTHREAGAGSSRDRRERGAPGRRGGHSGGLARIALPESRGAVRTHARSRSGARVAPNRAGQGDGASGSRRPDARAGGPRGAAARGALIAARRCGFDGREPAGRGHRDAGRARNPSRRSALRAEAHGAVRGTARQVGSSRVAADARARADEPAPGHGRCDAGGHAPPVRSRREDDRRCPLNCGGERGSRPDARDAGDGAQHGDARARRGQRPRSPQAPARRSPEPYRAHGADPGRAAGGAGAPARPEGAARSSGHASERARVPYQAGGGGDRGA